jgi:hypothetical protein
MIGFFEVESITLLSINVDSKLETYFIIIMFTIMIDKIHNNLFHGI